MARATDYSGMVRQLLEGLVQEALSQTPEYRAPYVYEGDVHHRLDTVANRLRQHDGWADWREINAAIREAGLAACKRRRLSVWQEVRQAVENWKANN